MLLTTLLSLALLHNNPPVTAPVGTTTPETAEGVEILRRILVEALDKEFLEKGQHEQSIVGPDGRSLRGIATTLWLSGDTVQNSRAFHMPEVGLFLSLDASLPVVEKKAPKDPGKGQGNTGDEWERFRRAVRGDSSTDGPFRFRIAEVSPEGEIDPQAIERVTDLVLRTLARHASRIEGLAAGETITVGLRLSGRSQSWLHDFRTDENGAFTFGLRGALREDLGDTNEDRANKDEEKGSEDVARHGLFSAYVLGAGDGVRSQNLVIRIALADLVSQPEASADRLRQRAAINRY
jgi:hypothetical protein